MPRRPNRLEGKDLKLRTNQRVLDMLEELNDTGLYGNTTAETAARLIDRGLEAAVKDGLVRKPRSQRS